MRSIILCPARGISAFGAHQKRMALLFLEADGAAICAPHFDLQGMQSNRKDENETVF
jgi:hypothetical protein